MKRIGLFDRNLKAVFTGREACDTSVLICMFACLQGGKEQNRERKKKNSQPTCAGSHPLPTASPSSPSSSHVLLRNKQVQGGELHVSGNYNSYLF